ncbi:ligand-binding sensor domain-containing protein [Flocculibacter collagenilyticus]|uniref:ligand-binding sensor domain-containing protein n=1 Tax=Flocculibacter collagenilyticus TaxID=2744479 RepID=UPI0018F4E09E|nr:ligand-binding sensor domain-containing diguanylate cyclase [Flocculibacter collagenilyticus]
MFRLALLLFLFAFYKPLFASIYDYDVKEWNTSHGLSSQSTRAITKDEYGYIWVGTLYGLNRFDGERFKSFQKSQSVPLPSNWVSELFTDNDGYVWIGTKNGLAGVDPTTQAFTQYDITGHVTDILQTPSHSLYVAAEGIYIFNGGTFTKVDTNNALVNQLALSPYGVWAASDSDIFLLQNGIMEKSLPLPDYLKHAIIHDLLWDGSRLLIATERGIYQMSVNGTFTVFPLPTLDRTIVYRMIRDKHDALWVSAMGQLFHKEPNKNWQVVHSEHLGHAPWFTDLYLDDEGVMWLASASDGLWRSEKGIISRHQVNHYSSVISRTLAVSNEGLLWASTQQGLAVQDKHGYFNIVLGYKMLNRRVVHTIHFEPERVVMGTENGVAIYQNGKVLIPPSLTETLGKEVRIIEPDESGFWIGSNRGLMRYQNETLSTHTLSSTLPSQQITAVREIDEQLWVGTSQGLTIEGDARFNAIEGNESVSTAFITTIQQLDTGEVVVGTLENGMFVRNNDQEWMHYDATNGLPYGSIMAMYQDKQNNLLWVSTLKGIYRIEFAQLIKQVEHITTQEILTEFDRQLGAEAGRCCNGFGDGKIVPFNNSLWLPTTRGIVEVELSQKQRILPKLNPLIESVNTKDHSQYILTRTNIPLDVEERDIRIAYTAIDYISAQNHQYRYRILPLNKEWVYANKRREAIFTNLPSGQFIFEVQAKRKSEKWSNAETSSLRISIDNRFSETIFYRIIIILMIFYGLYLFFKIFKHREQVKNKNLKQLVEVKTRELKEINTQLNNANLQLQENSQKDELSGLRNRQFLLEQLPKDIEHFQRNREALMKEGKSIAVLVIDIDLFKHVNDTHGPVAGDMVLQQFAALLTAETRGSDYVVRWGGDEFLVLLRDTQAENVKEFVGRLNTKVAEEQFMLPKGGTVNITCSIGYAFYPLPMIGGQLVDWEVALNFADLALYKVKEEGRDGWGIIEFDEHLDAFEFEDSKHLEQQTNELVASGMIKFNVHLRAKHD